MNVDLEDIRTIVNRHPNIRGKNLLHQLEKRRKVEELREEREKAKEADKPLWSPFLQWLGKRT